MGRLADGDDLLYGNAPEVAFVRKPSIPPMIVFNLLGRALYLRRRSGHARLASHLLLGLLLTASCCGPSPRTCSAEPRLPTTLAGALQDLSPRVLSDDKRRDAARMVDRDIRDRRDAANAENRARWLAIEHRQDWESFRDRRLESLRQSLNLPHSASDKLNVHVTRTVQGEGFRIENVVYESRPGDWVAGNLYLPAEPRESMPGILIVHSHHRPKHQGELQDMGMTWSRAGCTVLVIDQVGYGERRAHPFHGPGDYSREYPWQRQDYYYRYDAGIQLQLVGDSLMGWMVWDLMRGVDLLLERDNVDPHRILILGAVAGGGDPCGVTAALDRRIAAAAPFNFGGPQPETRYPLPDDAETSFNYLMGSYWESTRGLRRTAADGFFHWAIVGGIAPRRLIHAHEFSWDRERDPVWQRYQRIYGDFYGVPDHLAAAHGKGTLQGEPAEASHCTNIGRLHRRMIHPVFQRWFDIEVRADDEYSARREPAELTCLTEAARREIRPVGFVRRVSDLGRQRLAGARGRLAKLTLNERRKWLREHWSRLLGEVQIKATPEVESSRVDEVMVADATVERVVLEFEPGIVAPILLISSDARTTPSPVVVALAQAGKAGFLTHRSKQLADLVRGGAIVCLPDVRGTGETKAGTSRGRTSSDGNRSVNLLLFDQTMLGQRLRDVRSVLAYLRSRGDVDASRIALWGDSLAPVNPIDTEFDVPRGIDGRPHQSEPLGGLLAFLGALFDEDVAGVYVHGGLSGYQAVLSSPHVYIPHDVVIPGALTAGDLCDVAAALAPRPLRLDGLVDGLNRRMTLAESSRLYELPVESYRQADAERRFVMNGAASASDWLLSIGLSRELR